MRKDKDYKNVIFSADVIKGAARLFLDKVPKLKKIDKLTSFRLTQSDSVRWTYDSEDEFFADYRRGFEHALTWKM